VRRLLLLCLAALLVGAAAPLAIPPMPAWTRPAKPFRVVGPIHYVGTEGIGVYLIETRDGLILLDGGLEETVPQIEASIAALGFRLSDVKLIIATHAHFDHVAGLAALKRDSGATLAASPGDRGALDTGTPPSEIAYGVVRFPPVKVDRVLVDGRPVSLGGVAMTPVFTPGHTPGCTTWTMRVTEAGRPLSVVFPCSMTVAGNKLIGNRGYPGIVADFRRTFARMRTLHPDVVLPAHPEMADVLGRAQRRDAGDADAFIGPEVLPRMVDEFEAAFESELKKANGASPL
jgi:metallo-beta-lactamase class B